VQAVSYEVAYYVAVCAPAIKTATTVAGVVWLTREVDPNRWTAIGVD